MSNLVSMSAYAMERAAQRVRRAAASGLDLVAFWEEARAALRSTVPYHLTPCWYTLDPASLLVTSHFDHGLIPELPGDWLAHEYHQDDVMSLAGVARSPAGIATLHELTAGDPGASEMWERYVRPFGGEQQLFMALRTRGGETWGVLALYRAPGEAPFSTQELSFLSSLSAQLAEGARRALLIADASDPDGPDAPGLVIVDSDWSTQSLTPGVERWLQRLPRGAGDQDSLPPAVLSVAGQARRAAAESDAEGGAFARARCRDGRWVLLHGAPLDSHEGSRVAVILEPAEPARIAPLLMSAYGLTEREQEITRLVLRGDSTSEIAGELSISPHTVQQHLKSIFEKTSVRSRRELVGKVFFAHYEPRLRDNERRAGVGEPLRGGPFPLAANAGR